MANVTEMPPPEASETPDTPIESAPEQATPAPKPAKNGKHAGGRPAKGAAKLKPEGKAPIFFKAVEDIPQEDWGTRAFMYLYIDEPVCIAKTWGETRYAKKFHAPIFDLEPLKELYGSFKGWLSLNIRKTGKDATDQTDRLDFEIFDPLAPPKIPIKTWANDSRNERWRALMPPEKPTPTESAGTMIDAMRMYKEIRSDVKEELPEVPAPTDQTKSTLETMKLAKELFAQPAVAQAPAAKDPLTVAVELATTMMQMKADNPMVDFLNKQMDRQHQEMMEMRKELAEARKEPAEKPKSFFDQLMEFAGDENKLERIKKVAGVFGFGGGDAGPRSSRFTGLELMREIVNSPFGSQLGGGLGTLLQNLVASGQSNGGAMPPNALNPVPPNGAGAAPGVTHESDQVRIQRIAAAITNPMMNEYFDLDVPGEDFASWFYDGFPEDFLFMRKLGADTVVNLYQQYNQGMWQHIVSHPKLGNREQKFRKFMRDAYAWKTPDEEDGEEPDTQKTDGVRDLDNEGAEG